MRIAYIAAGAGAMYCGACARDATLARGLIARGHEVQLIPLYTPMKLERDDVPMDPVYFGGVNVYLQQAAGLFRWVPGWMDRVLDRPGLLKWVSGFGIEVEAKKLGPMTVSMLAGTHGRQKKEVERLMRHLEEGLRPEVVNLTNSLVSGLAPELKRRLKVPVVCTYQGEESFVADLPEPHRTKARELVRENSKAIDLFVCPSEAMAEGVATYLGVERGRLRVIRTAVEPVEEVKRGAGGMYTVGFLSVIRPGKGLDLLVEAVRLLIRERKMAVRLVVAGRVMNPVYWKEVRARMEKELAGVFEYVGEVDEAGKAAFMRRVDVFCVPSRFAEPRGVAVLEAMAAGVPVVVPNTGVYPELLELGGGGLLVMTGEASGLAEALGRLGENVAERLRMGKAARELVLRHCSTEEMVSRTVAAYEEVAGRGV